MHDTVIERLLNALKIAKEIILDDVTIARQRQLEVELRVIQSALDAGCKYAATIDK